MRVIEYIDAVDGTMRCVREEDFLSVRNLSKEEKESTPCWCKFSSIPEARFVLADTTLGDLFHWSATTYKDIVAQLKSNSTGNETPSDREYQKRIEMLQRMG